MTPPPLLMPPLLMLRRCVIALLAASAIFPFAVRAQALQLPAAPAAQFAPKAGAQLPLDAVLRDQAGVAAPLGSRFAGKPVVLVPVYYTCKNLCSTLFEGVLQALAMSGLPAGSYRLVGVSVDPHDGPAAAADKERLYAQMLPGGSRDLAMLTGDAHALARVEATLGYRAVPDPDSLELAHAAGFVVADATGRVTRYFNGVRFDPAALRAAVQEADEGQVEQASFARQIVLLCARFAPSSGLHNDAALAAVRVVAVLVMCLLAAFMWRRRRSGGAV